MALTNNPPTQIMSTGGERVVVRDRDRDRFNPGCEVNFTTQAEREPGVATACPMGLQVANFKWNIIMEKSGSAMRSSEPLEDEHEHDHAFAVDMSGAL
jgi:hypothetical protein